MAGEVATRVGERIRERRLERGWNQRQLADLIPEAAVNNQRISNWERGVNMPSERYLKMLAEALEVDVAYFYATETTTPPLLNVVNGGSSEDRLAELLAAMQDRQAAIEDELQLLRAERATADAEVLERIAEVRRAIEDLPRP